MRELMPTPRVVDARAVAGQMTQMSQIKKLTERRELSIVQSSGGDCCDQLNRSKSSARRVTKENAVKTKT